MGRRSRRASAARGTSTGVPAPAPPRERPPRRSSEEKDAEVRAGLEPLGPGERPGAVTAGVVVCAIGFAALSIGAVSGLLDTGHRKLPSLLLSILILAIAGVGMQRGRYWAVLGFEVLLLLNILAGFILLLRASTVLGLLISLVIIVPSSYLFYKLIRALARLQVPARQ